MAFDGCIPSIDLLRRSQRSQEVNRSTAKWNASPSTLRHQYVSWCRANQRGPSQAGENIRKINDMNIDFLKLTVFASRVFPVPDGPAIKKLATGRLGLERPLLESLTAFATAFTASYCPTTLSDNTFSRRKSFSFSVVTRRVTGMLVHFATISAICSAVTVSLSVPAAASSAAFFASSCSRRVCRSGSAKYRRSDAAVRSYLERK